MNISSIKPIVSKNSSKPRRRVLAALLLAALAVAIVAGSALAANLVVNGSFEKDTDGNGVPNQWILNDDSGADTRVCNQSYVGACSFKMVGAGAEIFLIQITGLSGGGGDSFKLSFWARGKNIDLGTTGILTIYVIIDHTDDVFTDTFNQNITPGNTPWTKYVLELTATEDYEQLIVEIFQDDLAGGKAWFDKVKLVAVP